MKLGIRELLFVLVLLAMPLAAYFFVFEPRNRQIAEVQREIAEKQAELKQLEQATMSINDLQKEIGKLEEAIAVFQEKLPEQREVEVILRRVWELAAKQRLTPKSVRTDKPVKASRYNELPITMTITGDFDGFYQFLLDIEKLNRITRLPKMKLKKLGGDSDGPQMEADITLSIFFESNEDASASRSAGRDRL